MPLRNICVALRTFSRNLQSLDKCMWTSPVGKFFFEMRRKVEHFGKKSFTPVGAEWLSLYRHSRNSVLLIKFIWRFSVPKYVHIGQRKGTYGYTFMYAPLARNDCQCVHFHENIAFSIILKKLQLGSFMNIGQIVQLLVLLHRQTPKDVICTKAFFTLCKEHLKKQPNKRLFHATIV